MKRSSILLFLLTTFTLCRAQVAIENQGLLPVPTARAQAIFGVACRAVAEEFHLKHAHQITFPLTLVLGSPEDRYEDDHDAGVYRLYLKTWDDKKFAVGVMRLALQNMINRQQRDRLVWQILTRADAISPVSLPIR
jgi:hypothetical protein